MMLTIELEPEQESILNNVAQLEHRSPNEIIKQLINDYIQRGQKSNPPKIACFANQDSPETEKNLRNDKLSLSTMGASSFIEHLLSMPCDDGEFERLDVQLRDFE